MGPWCWVHTELPERQENQSRAWQMLWGGRLPPLSPSEELWLHGASEDTAGILGRGWLTEQPPLRWVWGRLSWPGSGLSPPTLPWIRREWFYRDPSASVVPQGFPFLSQVTAPGATDSPEHGATVAAPGNSTWCHLSASQPDLRFCSGATGMSPGCRTESGVQQGWAALWARPPSQASKRCSAALAPHPANLHLSEPLVVVRAEAWPITYPGSRRVSPALRPPVLSPGMPDSSRLGSLQPPPHCPVMVA